MQAADEQSVAFDVSAVFINLWQYSRARKKKYLIKPTEVGDQD